jgi:hypothetical protein
MALILPHSGCRVLLGGFGFGGLWQNPCLASSRVLVPIMIALYSINYLVGCLVAISKSIWFVRWRLGPLLHGWVDNGGIVIASFLRVLCFTASDRRERERVDWISTAVAHLRVSPFPADYLCILPARRSPLQPGLACTTPHDTLTLLLTAASEGHVQGSLRGGRVAVGWQSHLYRIDEWGGEGRCVYAREREIGDRKGGGFSGGGVEGVAQVWSWEGNVISCSL